MRAFQRAVLAVGIVTAVGAAACTGENAFCANGFCGGDAGGETGNGRQDARGDTSGRQDAKNDAPGKGEGGTSDAGSDGRHVSDGGKDAAKDVAVDSFVCDPMKAPSVEPCVISETYGVFVAPAANGGSDTAGTGTRLAPYATIGTGITKAKVAGKRVYACAATYAEQLLVNAAVDGVQLYGGLTCPATADAAASDAGGGHAWAYSGSLTKVEPAAVGYALDVESLATGAHFEDMGFAPQVAPTAPGASSIAVMVNASAGVSFTRVSATALAGVAGVGPGAPPTNWCDTATGPQAGGGSLGVAGGLNGSCTCAVGTFGGTPESSTGGPGGGATGAGTPSGTSNPPVSGSVSPIDGAGGDGTLTAGSGGKCANGDQGANGAAASGGASGGAGALSALGWLGASGKAGGAGNPGQGGGGGGGAAKGGTGGGAGGCGGNGGGGGSGGGASLAVALVSSVVTFASVTLHTAAAGQGGSGGAGETGQTGGANGVPVAGQCSGNIGGDGAGGSGGGGGSGGPSVGIAWTGSTAPVVDGSSIGPTTPTLSLPAPSSFLGGVAGGAGAVGSAGAVAQIGNNDNPGSEGTAGSPGVAGAVAKF